MFDSYGCLKPGHGVIPEIDMSIMESQLEKRAQNYVGYYKKIIEELRTEQPAYHGLIMMLAEGFANERCQRDTPDWHFWYDRFSFVVAFTYKITSLCIEEKYLQNEIQL